MCTTFIHSIYIYTYVHYIQTHSNCKRNDQFLPWILGSNLCLKFFILVLASPPATTRFVCIHFRTFIKHKISFPPSKSSWPNSHGYVFLFLKVNLQQMTWKMSFALCLILYIGLPRVLHVHPPLWLTFALCFVIFQILIFDFFFIIRVGPTRPLRLN